MTVGRALLLATACAALCIPAAGAATRTVVPSLASPAAPSFANLGRQQVTIRDRVLPRLVPGVQARRTADDYGGVYTAASGDKVRVYISSAYPADNALNQKWANFLGALIHGPEISLVRVEVMTPDEVHTLCQSTEADACYDPQFKNLIVPAVPQADGVAVEELVAHEYGHHIAMNRRNDPWDAYDWGPKRWATSEQICSRARAHTAFPADEGFHYLLNPGEGWAESYRELNDKIAQRLEQPWNSDQSFYPNDAELAATKADVVNPWSGPSLSTWAGSFRAAGQRLVRVVSTPLDGTLRVRVHASHGAVAAAYAPATAMPFAAGAAGFTTNVCGERTVRISLRARGAGPFAVTISRP